MNKDFIRCDECMREGGKKNSVPSINTVSKSLILPAMYELNRVYPTYGK